MVETIPEFQPYVNAFIQFEKDYVVKVVENEKSVFSEKYQYAGTMDILGEHNGELCIIDVKTSKDGTIYPEAELQISAYWNALQEIGTDIQAGYVLALGANGKYQFKQVEYQLEAFLACKKLWTWKNKDKCQAVGYSLS